jgi:hypothetical protein
MANAVKKYKGKGGGRTFCSAVNCSNSKHSHPELSFFRFPRDTQRYVLSLFSKYNVAIKPVSTSLTEKLYFGIFRSKEWVVLCRREDFAKKDAEYLYKNVRICAQHFEDIMFSNDLKNRLNPEAKPTLFNIPNPPPTVGVKRRAIERKTVSHSQGSFI